MKSIFTALTFIGFFFLSINVTAQITTSSQWKWVKGDNTINQLGTYGTQGTAAAANKPGARRGSISWTDPSGNFWIFGGHGYASTGFGYLNDLWKYSPTSNEWTWVKGDNIENQVGVYGTQGTAATSNKPGARYLSVTWIDASGNFWLFGGYGYAVSGFALLNDLWKYNPTTNEWTWVKGDNTINQLGVYGTQGTFAAANKPGAREGSISWIDASGNFWLFGGFGYTTTVNGYLNDLWKYDPTTNQWTWMKGDNSINQTGLYGTQGTAAATNKPGARYKSVPWKDASGNLWLFSGEGYATSSIRGYLNDSWKYNFTTNEWTWVEGDNTINQLGVYGTQGTAAAANKPGARFGSITLTDASGNFWLFGGYGYAVNGVDVLNDLWKFNVGTNDWTWVKGDNTINQLSVYGTQGTAALTNKPGARFLSDIWKDATGNFWLFGGNGYATTSSPGFLNDLWKIGDAVQPPTITSFTPTSGNIGTTVTITGTNFNATAANNIVYFGAVKASVTAATTTSLTVTAPAGATYQPISVLNTVTGLSGYSSTPFITTFTNPFGTGIPTNYYTPKVDFTTGSAPVSVAFGDIDGDGKPEMVAANYSSNSVSVFRNISTSGSITSASFDAKVDFTTSGPFSVKLGDIDGDGKLDMVTANFNSGTVSVFRNISTSGSISSTSFATKQDFSVGANPYSVELGDLDGDGKTDLVTANTTSNSISVLRNTSITGSTTFAAKVDFSTVASGNTPNPRSITVGDVDGDGKLEILVTNQSGNYVSVFRNISSPGSITSASFEAKVDFITGPAPYSVVTGDLDGDGKPEMIVANFNSTIISVYRNIATSGSITTSSFSTKVDFTTLTRPSAVAIGDIDGDGKIDLAVSCHSTGPGKLAVFRNTATSGSIASTSFAARVDFTTGTTPSAVAIGDLNGDGLPELAVSNDGSASVSVFQIGTPQTSTTDYFRTKQSGNWNDVNTWESATDANFTTGVVSPATLTPDFNAKTITILNGHTVTVTADVTTDQTTVNSGGALIVDPNKILTINDGTGTDLNVDAMGSMTIRSTSAGTGSIGNSNGFITGEVTVERFITSASNRAYRLLAPSVTTTGGTKPFIRDNWQEGQNNTTVSSNSNTVPNHGTHITGSSTGANGFDATPTGQGSLFTYNQGTDAYVAAANTGSTNLNAKTGYLLYIRGDRTATNIQASATSSNTTLRATGTLLMGTQTFTNLAPAGSFSLVTNPYASAINWSSIYANNSTNFQPFYTFIDPNIGDRGGYVTVNSAGTSSVSSPNTGSSTANANIQSGQAFFIKTRNATPPPRIAVVSPTLTFTIQENHKSTTNNIDVFRTVAPAAQKFTASLFFNSADHGRRIADGVTALYDNTYNAALDGNDAEEIANFDENIAIARAGKNLSIEERPIITGSETMPLFISNMKQQGYEWEFNPTNFAPNMVAQLVDRFTGNNTYLNMSAATVVPFTVTADAASSATDRFYIQFSPSVALPVTLSSVKAYQKGTGVQVDWTIQQESNMDRYEVERSADGQSFTKVGSVTSKGNSNVVVNYGLFDAAPLQGVSFYRIKAIDKNAKPTFSQVVKVTISSNVKNAITVSPNPVTGSSVAIQLNLPKGNYTLTLTNKLGQQLANKVVQHAGGSATETLEPSSNFAAGTYQLKVKGNGINITEQVIKK